jgi:hypothetical protein
MSSKCEMQLQGWFHSSKWGNDTKLKGMGLEEQSELHVLHFLLMDFKMCRLNEPCNPRKLVLYAIKKYLQYFKDIL